MVCVYLPSLLVPSVLLNPHQPVHYQINPHQFLIAVAIPDSRCFVPCTAAAQPENDKLELSLSSPCLCTATASPLCLIRSPPCYRWNHPLQIHCICTSSTRPARLLKPDQIPYNLPPPHQTMIESLLTALSRPH
ncbi:hypothetical protein C1H46_007556 [Malus baccata]|uniref:Uncharacterized protein n=1 Tax=Malus baccata TaxID=106549 RepID=A0A540N758_MALBA|nr:hypothetical protein C1H46_007556 [Malus baccata]